MKSPKFERRKKDIDHGAPRSPVDFASRIYTLVFGAVLALALLKFGNPVVLDDKIDAPASPSDFLHNAWPPRWGIWFLIPIALAGLWIVLMKKRGWRGPRRLWVLPVAWFGWQLAAATATVDAGLTRLALWQLAGCIACYFAGALAIGARHIRWLLPVLLAAFAFCLVRAVNQKIFEFPAERESLIEGQRAGWTNFPPTEIAELRRDEMIISSNGMEIANPAILQKYEKGRVFGTLVYPNALAGAVLLLWPTVITLLWQYAAQLRPAVIVIAWGLVWFLGAAALDWSGSKSGWLIAMTMGGVCWWRYGNQPMRIKWGLLLAAAMVGSGIFAVRFHSYFEKGATSVVARFDYWRAAVQITCQHPLFGTGPGSFQRPYAVIKSPAAEMARLAHNDYLEQFSDSGLAGGACYAVWIGLLLWHTGRSVWDRRTDPLLFAVFLGILAWFCQGLTEFSLYVPALAGIAFTFAGCLTCTENHSTDLRSPATLSPG